MTQHVTSRPVEVTGQIWGVQLDPPGEGEGGIFQILLDDGHIISGPYPRAWHLEIASALQANDVILIKVKGVGEHSPSGELQRIVETESSPDAGGRLPTAFSIPMLPIGRLRLRPHESSLPLMAFSGQFCSISANAFAKLRIHAIPSEIPFCGKARNYLTRPHGRQSGVPPNLRLG